MKFRKFSLNEMNEYDLDDIAISKLDLTYSNVSSKNKIDLYLPKNVKGNVPVLVFVHSGGFFKSDKRRHISALLNGLLLGYAVASINFRLNDEVLYPDSRKDAIDALNFLSKQEGIDKDKIVLWGEAYGSYLILDIVSNHLAELELCPCGVIDMYGATNLVDFHQYKIDTNQELIVRGRENDFNTFGEDFEILMNESYFLDSIADCDIPIFIIHGEKDEICPSRYSRDLEKVLKENNKKYEAHFIKDMGHGIDDFDKDEYNTLIYNFIKKTLEEVEGNR